VARFVGVKLGGAVQRLTGLLEPASIILELEQLEQDTAIFMLKAGIIK
jgi:hypothetical protein